MADEMQALVDLLGHPNFLAGVVAGLIVGMALTIVGFVTRRQAYGWGVLFSGAVIFVLNSQVDVGSSLLRGFAALAGAGFVVDLVEFFGRRRAGQVLLAVSWIPAIVAAWWFGTLLDPGEAPWISPMLSLTTLLVAAATFALGRSPVAGLLGPVFGIVVAGAWVTVPETDAFNVFVGVALPLGLATLPPARGRPLAAGAMALAGVFAWLVMEGGLTRPWTVMGGWAVAAIILVVAATVRSRLEAGEQVLVLMVAGLYAFAVTRVADITRSATVVAGASFLFCVAAVVGLRMIERRASPEVR